MSRKIISAREVETVIRQGGDLSALTRDGALLTPSARDLLRDAGVLATARPQAASAGAGQNDMDRLLNSADVQPLKEQLCDVGRRMWNRAYVDGNGGNLSIRLSENVVLCTPTLVSKGFMQPQDMCLVDLEGNQLAGIKKRTSEILMHLQIMKAQPRAKAVCHCHPPYATAFAVAGVQPPTCMIPEMEVFVGKVPIAPYLTPGTPEMGSAVAKLVDKHNTVLMANHGVVSWSHNGIEDAYFKMEIIEAYCRTVVVAAQLGKPLNTFTGGQMQDLLRIKDTLGIPDPRFGLKECELCDNDEFRPGVTCAATAPGGGEGAGEAGDPSAEAAVQQITDQILQALKSR